MIKKPVINVTKPFLPPLAEYNQLLKGIWERNWLTNNGPLVNELETRLKVYLQVPDLLFLNNGTIALQLAIKALNLRGEIITTPFSFIATTSTIIWEGCTPVFTDIDKDSFNIDADKIEAAITKKTSAILATHVYGNPCNIEKIAAIAKKYKLAVIYDAAHGFGTRYKNKSLFAYGDISTTSFHATKVYHTVEGGAVFTKNAALNKRLAYMRNFGFDGPERFAEVGINGKNSEFHAAMGLANLKYIDRLLLSRKTASEYYDRKLEKLNLVKQKIAKHTDYNYSYYPILFTSEDALQATMQNLEQENIFTRRYFYPLLNNVFSKKYSHLPVSENIARRVLCLPLFEGLTKKQIDIISAIITSSLKGFK